MRRLMPRKRKEKPSHNQKVVVLYASTKNSTDATVKNGSQAHYKYVPFRQIMAITNWTKQLAKARLATGHITSKHTFTRLASRKRNALYSANDRMDTRHLYVCRHQAHQGKCTEHRQPSAASIYLPDSTMQDGRTTESRCWMDYHHHHHSMFLHQYTQSYGWDINLVLV